MSQQLPFCTSLTKIKRDTAPGGLHASGVGEWAPTPQHYTHTHTHTEPLYQHPVLAMAFITGVTHSNTNRHRASMATTTPIMATWASPHPANLPVHSQHTTVRAQVSQGQAFWTWLPWDSAAATPGAAAGREQGGGHTGEVGGMNNTYRHHSKRGGGSWG